MRVVPRLHVPRTAGYSRAFSVSCWYSAGLVVVTEQFVGSGLRMGEQRKPLPLQLCPSGGYACPAAFTKTITKERSASQIDQPSPTDSITITMNAAPARSRGPIPCADRRESSNSAILSNPASARVIPSILRSFQVLKSSFMGLVKFRSIGLIVARVMRLRLHGTIARLR